MIISEFIANLEAFKLLHGDVEIQVCHPDSGWINGAPTLSMGEPVTFNIAGKIETSFRNDGFALIDVLPPWRRGRSDD